MSAALTEPSLLLSATTTTSTSLRRWPAEWEDHEACLILFPHNPQTFPRLDEAQAEVWNLAVTIARYERVLLLCRDAAMKQALDQKCVEYVNSHHHNNNYEKNHHNNNSHDHNYHFYGIEPHICPSNDTWARDTAPTFVVEELSDDNNSNNKDNKDNRNDNDTTTITTTTTSKRQQLLVGLDWDFNAYGGPTEGCYWPCTLDQQIAATVCRSIICDAKHEQVADFVLEGGSIHTDGQGTLLTTAECLLHPNRSRTRKVPRSPVTIEHTLRQSTGVTQVVWLPHGLAGDDDTNGHVDNFCAFVRPGHVVLAWTDNLQDDADNYHRCRSAAAVLRTHDMVIHKLYLPSPPLYYQDNDVDDNVQNDNTMTAENDSIDLSTTSAVPRHAGQRLAASYVNFYIANGRTAIVPQFGAASDQAALDVLSQLFDTVVGVPSRSILLGGGNLHCVTQQVPRVHQNDDCYKHTAVEGRK